MSHAEVYVRRVVIILAVVALMACASLLHRSPLIVRIEAQSLPITKTLAWDAPSDPSITGYRVSLDGQVIGSPTGTEQPFTIASGGPHTLSVVSVNLWSESTPATLSILVSVPMSPAGLRIQ